MRTELPKLWHIVVDNDNYKALMYWRFHDTSINLNIIEEEAKLYIDKRIIGVCGPMGEKGHNPKMSIKGTTYDFGEEITYQEFRELVLIQNVKEDLDYLKELLIKLNIK